MKRKNKVFQLRLTLRELTYLHMLAEHSGVSASSYLRNYIRREAKRRKIDAGNPIQEDGQPAVLPDNM
jgi:hypothetical protein